MGCNLCDECSDCGVGGDIDCGEYGSDNYSFDPYDYYEECSDDDDGGEDGGGTKIVFQAENIVLTAVEELGNIGSFAYDADRKYQRTCLSIIHHHLL